MVESPNGPMLAPECEWAFSLISRVLFFLPLQMSCKWSPLPASTRTDIARTGPRYLAMSTVGLIPMDGTLNTRDLGGLPTIDGQHVVAGRIYRSAELSHLSPRDITTLQKLGIDTVVDLRGPKEAKDAPDCLPTGIDYINSPIIGNAQGDNIGDATVSQLVHSAGLPESILNKAQVTEHGPYYRMLFLVSSYGTPAHTARLGGYRPLFQKLLTLRPTSKLLFHCTGGRDRTGVGAALLLKTLGVPDHVIEDNFVASNRYLQPDRDNPDSTRFLHFKSANVFLQPSTNKTFQQVATDLGATPDQIRGAVELRPELLRRMFRAIDERFGSFDTFLEQELGIDQCDQHALQRLYTHP